MDKSSTEAVRMCSNAVSSSYSYTYVSSSMCYRCCTCREYWFAAIVQSSGCRPLPCRPRTRSSDGTSGDAGRHRHRSPPTRSPSTRGRRTSSCSAGRAAAVSSPLPDAGTCKERDSAVLFCPVGNNLACN